MNFRVSCRTPAVLNETVSPLFVSSVRPNLQRRAWQHWRKETILSVHLERGARSAIALTGSNALTVPDITILITVGALSVAWQYELPNIDAHVLEWQPGELYHYDWYY